MRIRGSFLAAIVAIAFSFPALAQDAPQLVKRYTELAGSTQNASSLVTGLHEGRAITLKSGKRVATTDPASRKMGFGNVDNALALTQVSLEKRGIAHATPQQLKTALQSVLDQRAAGEGWGEIARSLGSTLGEIKSAQNEREQAERLQQARAGKPERAEKPDRPARPDRPGGSMRPDRPERPQI